MNRGLPFLAAIAVAWALPAFAQNAVPGLRGLDSDAPVDISAERTEVQFRNDRGVFSGNVRVTQGRLQIDTARIRVAYTDTNGTSIQRIDASGGVVVRSPTETARSSIAIYDLNRRLITMLGNVTLTRGASTLNGGRLVIDLNTGRATVDGSAVAGGATGTTPGGRVTGRFTVPKRTP